MSFFGFDSSGAQYPQKTDEKAYDFQDTYEGLGELEADDVLNSETFGVGEVSKNFDFGGSVPPPSAAATRPNLSFARAAANDDEFMKDLWGENTPEPAPSAGAAGQNERKVLSLEEIETQLTAIDHSQQQHHPQMMPGQHQYYPSMGPQYGGYGIPQGYMPPNGQYAMPYPGQFMPMQVPMVQQGMPPMPGMPVGMQPNMGHPNMPHPGMGQPMQPLQPGQAPQVPHGQHGQNAPVQPVANYSPQNAQPAPAPVAPPASAPAARPAQQVPQPPQHAPQPVQPAQPVSQPAAHSVPEPVAQQTQPVPRDSNVDMSQFPVLGAKGQPVAKDAFREAPQASRQEHDLLSQHHYGRQHAPYEELSPEEQQRLARRQEKVSKIMRYSGVMNPKDKDFVTRFQLSQIVTDDPYNEDFYAQVYKVIHPQSTPSALGSATSQQPNSIAQAYLDQSGHRLGGRYKRADVALQRMQQQVQKAVTVAKERQKLTHNTREGVLGKVSVGSGKKPRQQLVILSKAAQKAKEEEDQEKSSDPVPKKGRSPSMAAPSKPVKKYTKRDIMSISEDIINNLMTVESESRLTPDVDTSRLWDSLHVLDQASSSGDEESFVNPFVQCLNYAKSLKILPRLFKFLNREQILVVITLIMSNLENLKVIKNGSYTTYADKKIPEEILKLVDTYTLTFCKVLMNAVQDFKFNEIIGLLLKLIQHNVVSFVSTTKIGLSIVTTLLSRAELMKGEGTISATDLSAWTSCYDELFTALESRIAAIFPPSLGDTEDDYVWQFLATLSLGGKLSHQRIIVDEVRDEIFGVMNRAKAINNNDMANLHKKQSMLNNLNMYLVVMGLVADENEIQELKA